MPYIRISHALLEVLDEIIELNRHPPFDEFLLQTLFYRSDYYTFQCNYASLVLMSHEIESILVQSGSRGRSAIKQYRVRAIKHFGFIAELIQRAITRCKIEKGDSAESHVQNIASTLTELAFLVLPVRPLPLSISFAIKCYY